MSIKFVDVDLQSQSDTKQLKIEGMSIKWHYFFGAGSERFFSAKINGFSVEKKVDKSGTRYTVGNFDTADKFFHSEKDLIEHLKSRKSKLVNPPRR